MGTNKNKGYSLVEMIIVLAIVIILAGLSLVSMTLVNTARAKDASNKFGSEVSNIRKKAIEMKPGKTDNDPYYDPAKAADYRYGLVLHEDDGKFQTDQVIVEKKSSGEYVFRDYNHASDGSHAWPAYASDGSPVRENVQYSSRVEVKFTGKYYSFSDGFLWSTDKHKPGSLASEEGICILFDKHGNCLSGYGEYRFYKRNSNQVARVIIRQNGSIEIR